MLAMPVECMADAHTGEWKRQDAIATTIRQSLQGSCPVFIADNVAEYVYREFDHGPRLETGEIGRTGKEWSFSRIGSLAPPFKTFFIEWRTPAWIRESFNAVVPPSGRVVPASGWFIFATTPDEGCLERAPNAKQRLVCAHCFQRLNGSPAVSGNVRQFAIDEDGNYLASGHIGLNGPDYQHLSGSPGSCAIALQTIGFTNCKNVSQPDVTSSEGPTPKWCRRQRVPELKYRAVQIDPNVGASPRAGERKTAGGRSGKALHICRGHFANFRDDGVSQGLFGRRQYGTFWIPAHTRGSLEHGRVIPTYNVKAPCDSARTMI